MGRFANQVALVTGGSSGIGNATARRLLREGATVIVADINQQQDLQAHGSSCSFRRLDVTDRQNWMVLLAEIEQDHGRLDILVNSAGILREGSIEETSYSQWREVIAVNLTGTFWGCQVALPLMLRGGSGSIINVSSVSGIKGDSDLIAYDASKGAVRLLTKEVALYCAQQRYNVRCNSIHPGIVATPMVEEHLATSSLARPEEWEQPDGRRITPEEVAGMIAWLASSEATFVTGAEYTIDGGMTA